MFSPTLPVHVPHWHAAEATARIITIQVNKYTVGSRVLASMLSLCCLIERWSLAGCAAAAAAAAAPHAHSVAALAPTLPPLADNSCINMVLERRTGIPITLSLVYMEVRVKIYSRLNKPQAGNLERL